MTDTPEAAFAQALAAFQAELPQVGKGQKATVPTKSGGQYQYSYADLSDVTEVAVPLLSKHGLAWTASPTLSDAGFVLRYSLVHVSGHREGGDYPLPDPSRSSSQEIGSALTYARRYALTAVTGIAPGGDDDDGARAGNARAADPLPRDPGRSRGRTTRTNGSAIDPQQADEWTEVFTDSEWLTDFHARLVLCTTPAEVRGLDAEAHQMFATKRLTADDAKDVKAAVDGRLAELTVKR